MDNRFNLIDEPWIPVADVGLVSLSDVFHNPDYRELVGNPVEKIALTKLLLAIAQAAATPQDETQWRGLGSDGLAKKCLNYLEIWHNCFYLFGDRPFLQMPAIKPAKVQPYGILFSGVAAGNATIIKQSEVKRVVSEAEIARGLVVQMSMALGGKKVDDKITLSAGYSEKSKSGKPGPGIGYFGYLHSFLLGENLQETLWINLLTSQRIDQTNMFPGGVGVAPWESMPQGEDCSIAQALRDSVMGRLVPLCRFCLLTDQGLHYSEGLAHASYKDGVVDPTMSVNYTKKDPKVLWAKTDKRPWRELTSLLSFVDQTSGTGIHNLQIRMGLERVHDFKGGFCVWSGGLQVTNNAGEQYASGKDDFVESLVRLNKKSIGKIPCMQLSSEMEALSSISGILYSCVCKFFKELNPVGEGKDQKVGKSRALKAQSLFWELCERDFQTLVYSCENGEEKGTQRIKLRRLFTSYLHSAYNQTCAQETASQIKSWAKNRPNLFKYLKQES
ncbi:type I-E CRISPR-associated protein Cse1/CasA (plasmid) [Pseudomonas silesiensis]|uniref:type I-E CRISPR-associated protein Cse1/CasA n=1 Tax=Pseudomonas silesiensis TaxID=1853130 RepID=UPI0030D3213E